MVLTSDIFPVLASGDPLSHSIGGRDSSCKLKCFMKSWWLGWQDCWCGDCLPALDPRDTLTSEPNHKANIPSSCLQHCCTGQYYHTTTPTQQDLQSCQGRLLKKHCVGKSRYGKTVLAQAFRNSEDCCLIQVYSS